LRSTGSSNIEFDPELAVEVVELGLGRFLLSVGFKPDAKLARGDAYFFGGHGQYASES
jgi:hypothetical protein